MTGEKIRELRKKAGMTQTQLSEKLNADFGLNTDRVMVSKWETGFQTPVVSTLACIAKLFGVSLDYINGTQNNEKGVRVPWIFRINAFLMKNLTESEKKY